MGSFFKNKQRPHASKRRGGKTKGKVLLVGLHKFFEVERREGGREAFVSVLWKLDAATFPESAVRMKNATGGWSAGIWKCGN